MLDRAYMISMAAQYIRKARHIFEELELDNVKVQGDIRGLLQHCSELLSRIRRTNGKGEHKDDA